MLRKKAGCSGLPNKSFLRNNKKITALPSRALSPFGADPKDPLHIRSIRIPLRRSSQLARLFYLGGGGPFGVAEGVLEAVGRIGTAGGLDAAGRTDSAGA